MAESTKMSRDIVAKYESLKQELEKIGRPIKDEQYKCSIMTRVGYILNENATETSSE